MTVSPVGPEHKNCRATKLLLLLTFIWREFEKCSKSAKSTVTVCSFCHLAAKAVLLTS